MSKVPFVKVILAYKSQWKVRCQYKLIRRNSDITTNASSFSSINKYLTSQQINIFNMNPSEGKKKTCIFNLIFY